MGRLSGRMTYANVMATIAVFVALGGGAYALTLPKNSVRSENIKNRQVKKADLRANAVTSSKVRDGSLRDGDFGPGQLPSGPPGPSVAGYAVLRANTASPLPADQSFGSTVTLNTGTDNSGPITVSFPARLIATGTTKLQNGNGNGRVMGCRLVLDPGPDQELISPITDLNVPTFAQATATVTGAVDVEPGTYDLGMECRTRLANAGGAYSDVGLTVVAVGR